MPGDDPKKKRKRSKKKSKKQEERKVPVVDETAMSDESDLDEQSAEFYAQLAKIDDDDEELSGNDDTTSWVRDRQDGDSGPSGDDLNEEDLAKIIAAEQEEAQSVETKTKKKKKKTSESSSSSSSQVAPEENEEAKVISDEAAVAALTSQPEFVEKFAELDISDRTKTAIAEMGFINMTKIQMKAIPFALHGKDVVASAKTGSGKTLAFLIPAIELLRQSKFKPRNGTGVIIVSPTRELCIQIYGVVSELSKHHNFTHGLVMGGTNQRTEQLRLVKGINLLVGAPGRLLDHLQHCEGFVYSNLQTFIVDEADRILEAGFEKELRQIIDLLPRNRQTLLFSATQTKDVRDIARISTRSQPVFVGVDEKESEATRVELEQGYAVVPSDKRFLLLYTFLRKYSKKKIIVFFSTCNAVKYYGELLNYVDIPVLDLHGQQKQKKRTSTFFEFCNAKTGTMLCTDVAARGLDIPAVDWIIQYDPPDDTKDYIHRVGRTARGLSGSSKGKALLFLLPDELGFLKYLKAAKVPLNEYSFPPKKIAKVQDQLEALVAKNYFLHKSAREAYRSYLQSYAQNGLKHVFDVHKLDLLLVAKSFGFVTPPKVHLKISVSKKRKLPEGLDEAEDMDDDYNGGKMRKKRHDHGKDNPYGRRHKDVTEMSKEELRTKLQHMRKKQRQWARG